MYIMDTIYSFLYVFIVPACLISGIGTMISHGRRLSKMEDTIEELQTPSVRIEPKDCVYERKVICPISPLCAECELYRRAESVCSLAGEDQSDSGSR